MADCMNIGSRREVFFDDTMIDRAKTTTEFVMHEPIQRECVMTNDEDWFSEGAIPYNQVFWDGDVYRMYSRCNGDHFGSVAYAESRDGIHWEKPDLGIIEYKGSKHNNLLLPAVGFDGWRVFLDENPDCKPDEKYKAVASQSSPNAPLALHIWASPDAIHFHEIGILPIKGIFDSVNTVLWNKETGTYQAFIRDYHPSGDPSYTVWTRDIRFSESKELFPRKGWPTPQPLMYSNNTDWQMYINSVMKCPRAEHVYIGFPSRYNHRRFWTDNYDELCGYEERNKRFHHGDPRYALAVSDTMFMTSRDGLTWERYNEAFLRPGPEHPTNWVYGSVYFSNGMVETPSAHPGCDPELSFYCVENRWFDVPPQIWRYSIRREGFVSQHAPCPEATLTTKPFIFKGSDLYINFSTSAYGHVRVMIEAKDMKTIKSVDLFGDSTDRHVRLDGNLAAFEGKEVTMSFHMCDADLYSFQFR